MDRAPLKVFEEFQWHHKGKGECNNKSRFIESVADISAGAAAVLKMLEASDLEKEHSGVPLVDNYTAGNLMRYAIRSLELLSEDAHDFINQANKAPSNR